MRGIVNIGEQGVEMLATASTPIRLRQVFGIDYFSIVTNKNADEAQIYDLYPKLAFIMARQAAGTVDTATTADYYDWLDQFEPLDVVMAVAEISNLYDRQAKTTSTSKKGTGRQSGRSQ